MFLLKRISITHMLCIGATIFSLLFIPTLSLLAHGEGGGSFETEVGDYFIDIGYYPERLETDAPARLDFDISHKSESGDVPFSNVWVRIDKGTKTIFATGVFRPEFGATGLLYTFGEAGVHTVYVRFQNNEGSIAETSFPVDVLENLDTSESSLLDWKTIVPILWGVLGLLTGAVLSFVLRRRKANKEPLTEVS